MVEAAAAAAAAVVLVLVAAAAANSFISPTFHVEAQRAKSTRGLPSRAELHTPSGKLPSSPAATSCEDRLLGGRREATAPLLWEHSRGHFDVL
ncbi:hypothetical protein EYF80_029279 [Liparis tanakae]|uniref:Secreted protein n=1 Tax=Liparis tanakae TaxID=230148 RepID=A0A4Z2H3L5_9TELE|nr:hypothetical protein EYF80_029279 [Liparis tanakae]